MHRPGVFAERLRCRGRLVPLPAGLDPRRAVLAEPLACCVGALAPLRGRESDVVVLGAGRSGC